MSLRLTVEEFEALKVRDRDQRQHNSENKPKFQKIESKVKADLELIFLSLGLDITREYRFHPDRKWRFDYSLPDKKIAIEYEGLPMQTDKSRHTTIAGFAGDCEKYSEAAILGWCVIRVNAISLRSGVAHDLIRRAIQGRA